MICRTSSASTGRAFGNSDAFLASSDANRHRLRPVTLLRANVKTNAKLFAKLDEIGSTTANEVRKVRTPDLDFFHKPILDTVLLGIPSHLLDLGHDTRDSLTWPTHDDRVFSEGLADSLHGNASTHRHKHTVLADKGVEHRAVCTADHTVEFARDTKVHGPKISSGRRCRGNCILHIVQHINCLLRILAAAVYEKNVVSARSTLR